MAKRYRTESEHQAFFLTRKVDRAIRDHNMIQSGDRILVGVSGGKDSLALLRLLNYRLRSASEKCELTAAHVSGDARGPLSAPPEALVRHLENEGVPFHIRPLEIARDEKLPMDCERCVWHRRKVLFEMADDLGCNKVALGHNLEDFAHTALINLFSSGRVEAMPFRREFFDGKFVVIRPLAYIRDHDLVGFAKACGFPADENSCPNTLTSRRQAARDILSQISSDFRNATVNIVRAASRNQVEFEEDDT